jgi:hypothetical protein
LVKNRPAANACGRRKSFWRRPNHRFWVNKRWRSAKDPASETIQPKACRLVFFVNRAEGACVLAQQLTARQRYDQAKRHSPSRKTSSRLAPKDHPTDCGAEQLLSRDCSACAAIARKRLPAERGDFVN